MEGERSDNHTPYVRAELIVGSKSLKDDICLGQSLSREGAGHTWL